MSTSPNLRLPYLDANQNQKTVTHNAALRMLDVLVNLHVASAALSAPPTAPGDGQCWIVASGGTGAWQGKDLNVAAWQDGAWNFYAPNPGTVAYVDALGGALLWNGTAWVGLLGAIASLALATLGVGTAADPGNPLSAKLNAALFAALPTTASPAGTGDVRVKLSKQAAANTASLLFQDAYSGRAEVGLVGGDDFHFKVSPDGATFFDALVLAATTGAASFLVSPTAPTPASGDSSTKLATTGFVAGAVAALVAAAPGALDTLKELADALGDDPNFAATVTNAMAAKASLASPTLSGTPTAPTPAQADNSTKLATTAYADRAAGANFARTQVNDAAYTVLASDRVVAVIALTAARILTLPAASAFPQGQTLTVVDESGACSATKAVTVAATGSDRVNGGASAVLASPYAYAAFASNGANKWTVVDGPSGSVPALNGGPLAGFRNRLINGNFAVNQRGQASGAALAAGIYGHDRWKAGANGCTYTFTAGTPDTTITVTAGTLQQIVEAGAVEGGVYTVSWAGSAGARVIYTATGASATTTTAYQVSPIVLPGVSPGTAMTVEFGASTVGLVQIEPGPTATPFERRPVALETLLCQRFYQANVLRFYTTTSYFGGYFNLPVPMRTTPSILYTDLSNSANNVSISASPGTTTVAIGAILGAPQSVQIDAILNANAGNWASIRYFLSAEL